MRPCKDDSRANQSETFMTTNHEDSILSHFTDDRLDLGPIQTQERRKFMTCSTMRVCWCRLQTNLTRQRGRIHTWSTCGLAVKTDGANRGLNLRITETPGHTCCSKGPAKCNRYLGLCRRATLDVLMRLICLNY